MRTVIALVICLVASGRIVADDAPLPIASPDFPASHVDSAGRLVEDWGTIDVKLRGDGITDGAMTVAAVTLEDVVPAVRAVSDHGVVALTRTVYRAPVFPAGVDVLRVELRETRGQPADVVLALDASAGAQLGQRTARIGGRTVLVLPREVTDTQPLLDWGYSDESVSLPGWGKPQGECDPAFRNIRAGMGGVPIVYRFAVPAGSRATVVLGLCESHWQAAGQRPLRCCIEGAEDQTVDPVAKWGVHQPGLLSFAARDADQDGKLTITVRPAPHAPDQNPILNAIWVFGSDATPDLAKVLAGQLNAAAQYYVDVGGTPDQSIYPPGKMEFPVHLEAHGTQELTFLVACPGASAPVPGQSDWNARTLIRAARDVWRDWPQ
jgi:hypothetical protein